MTLKEVYEKYKHLDKVLSDPILRNLYDIDPKIDPALALKNHILHNCWEAIKKELEGKK